MNLPPTAPPRTAAVPVPGGVRRVRHQARDAMALMVFSAASSTAVAAGLLLVGHLFTTGR